MYFFKKQNSAKLYKVIRISLQNFADSFFIYRKLAPLNHSDVLFSTFGVFFQGFLLLTLHFFNPFHETTRFLRFIAIGVASVMQLCKQFCLVESYSDNLILNNSK